MPENAFQEERKKKQSIRKKSKSPSRRQSKRQSRRQSRKQSKKSHSNFKGKGKSNGQHKHAILWDENELDLNEVVSILLGEPLGSSPIDLELSTMKRTTTLPSLQWMKTENYPFAMKIANTGYTAAVSGLWPPDECPKLKGGPLNEEYELSQIHFHWGENEEDGSEHLVDHKHCPLEAHAVFYKSSYKTHERARREPDGLIVVTYFYAISKSPNPKLQPVISNIERLTNPYTEKLIDGFTYSNIFPLFTEDYILYNGWMKNACEHSALWLICRQTLGISKNQLESFHNMIGATGLPILKNYRGIQETGDTKVFIVHPSSKGTKVVLHSRPPTPDTSLIEYENKDRKPMKSLHKRKSSAHRQSRRQSKRQSKGGKRQSKVTKGPNASVQRKSMKRKSKMK